MAATENDKQPPGAAAGAGSTGLNPAVASALEMLLNSKFEDMSTQASVHLHQSNNLITTLPGNSHSVTM